MDAVAQCVVIGLVMAPWVARNAVVYHAFIPGVTQGGVTFWGGLGPIEGHVIGGLNDPRVPRGFEAALPRSEVERDRWFYREGLRVIREHPARTLRVVLRKVPRLWFNLMKDEPSVMASHALGTVGVGAGALPGLSLLFAAANLVAMVLAGVGVARARPPAFAADLLLWLVLYFTVVHMAFFAVFRYSLPVYAYLFCFTAAGLTSLARPDAGARGGPRPGASVPAR